jgi:phosphoglycerate dehydrogenase-like enzyme
MQTVLSKLRCAVLDDYQEAAMQFGDWDSLAGRVSVHPFVSHFADEDSLVSGLADFEIIVANRERTPFPASTFARLPRLKLLITTGARNHVIDMQAAARLGVTVCATGGNSGPTAEFTWMLLMAAARNLVNEAVNLRAGGRWQLPTIGADLRGRQLGILGLGKIGSVIAGFGKAFGMNLVAWSQNMTDEAAVAVGAARALSLEALLEASDFVTVHLVLSGRTRGLIGREQLRRMKKTAFLINTARGPIVDRPALIEALKEGWIAGAAVDVFDAEPLPADDEMRALPNLLATPHLAHVARSSYAVYYRDAVEDIAAWLEGAPIRVLAAPDIRVAPDLP